VLDVVVVVRLVYYYYCWFLVLVLVLFVSLVVLYHFETSFVFFPGPFPIGILRFLLFFSFPSHHGPTTVSSVL